MDHELTTARISAWIPAVLLAALMIASPERADAQPEVELTFDDGPDGSGPSDGLGIVDNLETGTRTFGAGTVTATLTGTAVRSAIDEGRYGRAVDFGSGTGGLELTPWSPAPARVFYLWLLPRSTASGAIVSQENSFDVHFEAGAIVLGAYRTTGEYVTAATGLAWPTDGEFHHLTLQLDGRGPTPVITVLIDNTASAPLDVGFAPMPSDAPLVFGVGLDGLLDELFIQKHAEPGAAQRFDRDPTFCPGAYSCIEEVIHMQPRDFPHEVPVRFKSVYDEAACNATTPCPVLFEVSGGNACADDYSTPPSVSALVEAGFVVVAVDLYCEGGEGTRVFPTETSQLIAVKDYVMASGAVRDRISGPDYVASGCSHGAGTVAQWAMNEDDHPYRTFSRSSSVAGLCTHLGGELCPMVTEAGLARLGVSSIEEVDVESADVRAVHERGDLVGAITPELASTREIARSWGANDTGPICRSDGNFVCDEEGLYGVTYSSRRYRDVWERNEPVGAPTGYFVEDHQSNCQHCAAPSGEAFRCGVCLLRVGRLGMQTECPECLTYDDPSIERGPPGELCPIEASWYSDPLAAPPVDADGGASSIDGGTPVDGGPRRGGGGCFAAPGGRGAPLGLTLALGLAWVWRRARRAC